VTETSSQPRSGRAVSGFTLILGATAIAGVASYAVALLVPGVIGLADYKTFSIFWSSIYLVVGALSGIQQEVTRATGHRDTGSATRSGGSARNFAGLAAVAVFVAVVGSAPLWQAAVFPLFGWSLVWPLAVGAASYVAVAVLCGSLYGITRWVPLASLMTADALLRLVGILVVLAFTRDIVTLAWAVALPFPGAIVLLWLFIRRSIVGKSQLDVGYAALTRNVLGTTLAAASTGIMVSGFPLILGLTSPDEPDALLGLYILCITVTRAPLIVVAMSLQSYFIVTFRDAETGFWRSFLRLEGAVLAAGVVLAAAAWAVGPWVYSLLYPGRLAPDGGFLAVLVLSSALVGAMCISAPAVLARSKHSVFVIGWGVAAVVTVLALLLPVDLATRTFTSLLAGPVAGLAVHAVYLVVVGRRERSAAASAPASSAPTVA
jgi:hypothetical protein